MAALFPLELLADRRVRNLAPLETLEMMLPVIDEVSDEKVLTLCASHTLEASSDRMEDGAALDMMEAVSDSGGMAAVNGPVPRASKPGYGGPLTRSDFIADKLGKAVRSVAGQEVLDHLPVEVVLVFRLRRLRGAVARGPRIRGHVGRGQGPGVVDHSVGRAVGWRARIRRHRVSGRRSGEGENENGKEGPTTLLARGRKILSQ